MRDHEQAMLAYALLADVSQKKQQLIGRDKFLILTGVSACRAGWPDVAHRCRDVVLDHNPAHLIGKYASFADALRSADFEPFVKQLERFCGYERAEHFLRELKLETEHSPTESPQSSTGERALEILSGPHWQSS